MPVETQYSSLSVERQRVNFNRSVTYRYLHCSSALWQLQPDAPVVTASRVSNPICQKKISAPTKGASERKLPERGRAVNPYERFTLQSQTAGVALRHDRSLCQSCTVDEQTSNEAFPYLGSGSIRTLPSRRTLLPILVPIFQVASKADPLDFLTVLCPR